METFYDMSIKIIGELPISSQWMYDLGTLFLVICSICLIVIPITLIFKTFIGR